MSADLPALILASTSPYRRELLGRLRLPFSVEAPRVEERHVPGEGPPQRAARLALEKALAVSARHPGAIVIGSDQVAVCGQTILDKPGNAERCREQLQLLSGNNAEFHTAVAIACATREVRDCFSDITRVRFRRLDAGEIERYIAAEQPFDCAGGFRSESLGIALFDALASDDPTGLVGLPLIRLARGLRALGYALP